MRKPNNKIDFDQGLALGLFIAYLASGLIFGLTQGFQVEAEMLAPILTLGAAFLTVIFTTRAIRHQILAEQDRHDDARRGLYIGARARLLASLDETHRELNKALLQILTPKESYEFNQEVSERLNQRLEACIKFSDDRSSMHLASLIMRMQIVLARHHDLLTCRELVESVPEDQFISAKGVLVDRTTSFLDILHFRQSILKIFDYARFLTEEPEFHSALAEELKQAMFFLSPEDNIWNHPLSKTLNEMADRLYSHPVNLKDDYGLPLDITAE